MKVDNISIEKIKPYKNNPRDNINAVDKVAKSIEEFGWQQPIVIDAGGGNCSRAHSLFSSKKIRTSRGSNRVC